MTKSRHRRDSYNRNINYRAPFCLANFDFIVKIMNNHKKEKIQGSDIIKFPFYKHSTVWNFGKCLEKLAAGKSIKCYCYGWRKWWWGPEKWQVSVFKSTSFGFRCSSLGKEERTGGDSGTNLEHNRIPRLKKKNLEKAPRKISLHLYRVGRMSEVLMSRLCRRWREKDRCLQESIQSGREAESPLSLCWGLGQRTEENVSEVTELHTNVFILPNSLRLLLNTVLHFDHITTKIRRRNRSKTHNT